MQLMSVVHVFGQLMGFTVERELSIFNAVNASADDTTEIWTRIFNITCSKEILFKTHLSLSTLFDD
jgi:hypothetical protein